MTPAQKNLLLFPGINRRALFNYISALSGLVAYWPMQEGAGSLSSVIHPAKLLGRDIVINGDFATDTIWTKGTGVTIAGGVAVFTAVATGEVLAQSLPVIPGKYYEVTYTIAGYAGSGTVRARVGTTGTGTARGANGTYTEVLLCVANATFQIVVNSAAAFTGTIDTVSVKEVGMLASSSFPNLELTVNGDFGFNAAWGTLAAGVTIAGGVLSCVAASNVGNMAFQTQPIIIGRSYIVDYDLVVSGGSARFSLGGTVGSTRSASGHYTETVTCTTDSILRWQAVTTFTGQIYNVSVIPANAAIVWDGDMETAPTTSWLVTGTGQTRVVESTIKHSGTQSLKTVGGTGTSRVYQTNIFKPGSRYIVGAWVYMPTGNALTPQIRVGTTNVGSEVAAVSFATTKDTWIYAEMVFTATAANFLNISGVNSGETMYVDDVTMVEISPLTSVISGAIVGVPATARIGNSYLLDPTNDYVDAYSTALNSMMPTAEGTFVISIRKDWQSGNNDYIMRLSVDGSNYVRIRKSAANSLIFEYSAGGVQQSVAPVAPTTNSYVVLGGNWSKSGNAVKLFVNGYQVGNTQTGVDTWVGNLNAANTVLGASTNSGATPLAGNMAHGILLDTALSDAAHLELAKKFGVV